MISISDDVQVV